MSSIFTWCVWGVSWPVSTDNVLLDALLDAFEGFLYPLMGYVCNGVLVWNVLDSPVCLLACCLDTDGPFTLGTLVFYNQIQVLSPDH